MTSTNTNSATALSRKTGSRICDALRAEAAGLEYDVDENENLHVPGLRKDGRTYSMGRVSQSLIYQNPSAAHRAIGIIKFRASNQ